MCKFCKTENLEFDRIFVISGRKQPMGLHGMLETRLLLFASDPEDSIDEEADSKKWQLNVEVSSGPYGDDILEDLYIPIEYCPFCGRKLV